MVLQGFSRMGRYIMLAALCSVAVSGHAGTTDKEVVMYKDPNCGCCGKWAEHMRENGFDVREVATSGMQEIKQDAGVPRALNSCHTAKVGGYIVEGHVPAEDVKRLLSERPELTGIAAPGMPLGSPGMEGPYAAQQYDVVGFSRDGKTAVFSQH